MKKPAKKSELPGEYREPKDAPYFDIPEEKDVSYLENLHLLRPGKQRDVLTDVKIGLSNEELMTKYGFKTLRAVAYSVHRYKATVEALMVKLKAKDFKGKTKVRKPEAITQKTFQHCGKMETVSLVLVPPNGATEKRIIVDPEYEYFLYCKCKLIEHKLPEKYRKRWPILITATTFSHLFKEREKFLRFLSRYRWVDSKGFPFDEEIEMILTKIDDYRQEFEHLEEIGKEGDSSPKV